MAILSSSGITANTTVGRFNYQASMTASSNTWGYYNPFSWWLRHMDDLEATAARQRQRAAWFVPQKIRVMAPVPPVRRYQKMFQKHLFAPGRKK